jgi:outer membrane protease
MEGRNMKKVFLKIILMAAMAILMLPTTVLAEEASVIICYGTDGLMNVTLPTTDNCYTYGTTNADGTTATQTAANASVLPDSGWTWAVQKVDTSVGGKTYGYTMTLNNFNSNTTAWVGNAKQGNCIRFSNMDLRVVVKGTNTLATKTSIGTAIITETNTNNLLLSGDGTLNATGHLGMHTSGNLTIDSGTFNATGTLWGLGASSGNITINGGDVTATGGLADRNTYGIFSQMGSIIISGGNVTAKTTDTETGSQAFSGAPSLTGYKGDYQWSTSESSPVWTQSSDTAFTNENNPAYVKIESALTFADSQDYDIPAGIGGTAIMPIDFSNGVSSGKAPYTFSLENAPSWLSITEAGVVSGTRPAKAADAVTATVKVTDSENPAVSKSITIGIGAVTAAPIDYTMDFTKNERINWYKSFPDVNLTTTDASGTGWSWSASEKQLILSGLDFTTANNIGVKLPDGAKIVLTEGTTNTVKSDGTTLTDYNMGIHCLGSLTISGKGTLNVISAGKIAPTIGNYGISGTDIVISNGTINTVSGSSTNESFGINSANATIITNGTVTAKSTSGAGTGGAFSDAPTLTGYKGDYQWSTSESSPVWTQSSDTAFTNADNPAYVKIESALTFADSQDYDIPAGIAGTAITPVDFSDGVSSGKAPYTFSLENAPSWLSITEAGVVSGTRPAKAADAVTATVKVTDSENPAVSKSITIGIGAVTAAPIDYTMDFTKNERINWYKSFPDVNLTTTDASGTGWSWSASEKQLILSGLDFTTANNIGVKLPDGAKIVLTEGTTNTVKSDGTTLTDYNMGIHCLGSLTISGKGTLNVISAGKIAPTIGNYGISGTDIVISNGTINTVSGSSTNESFGINSANATIITNGTVTAKSTSGAGTGGAFSDAPTLTGYKGDYQWSTSESSPVWTQSSDTAFTNADNPAYVKIESALTFADSQDYDIPAGIAGTAITPVDFSDGVSSGIAPYTFSLENAPSWLSITEAGVVSGTRPAKAADAVTATVKVTDSEDPAVSKSITIGIGAVTEKPVNSSNPLNPSNPQTGDRSMLGFWAVIALLSITIFTANIITARKNRKA